MKLQIECLRGLEVLDSRGNPTIEVEVSLTNGVAARAQVPSGASTGKHEALELRDHDPSKYAGKGVKRAIEHVEGELQTALRGMNAEDQAAVDRRIIDLDGTPNKARLGANAILGASCAVARAVSVARGEPLWKTLAALGRRPRRVSLPVPMVNILSGGLHAGRNIEFQDFLALAHGFATFTEALHAVVAVHNSVRKLLSEQGCVLTGVADEGGWGPRLESNERAIEILTRGIEAAGYRPGEQISVALDVAASHFHREGRYCLATEERNLTAQEMTGLLTEWAGRYPIRSIEDPLDEDDFAGWQHLTSRLGTKAQIVGDDFFTTNPARVREGIRCKAANAVLVKMNQIGTLTETFEVLDLAAEAGWAAVVSARSGETEDSFLADLAVASGCGQIKVGSITRSERLAKYNRLLSLEREGGLSFSGQG